MTLIGKSGIYTQYGAAYTYAQLLGAVGANRPESELVPVGFITSFRSGGAAGYVAAITDTLSAVPPYTNTIPADAEAATFEIVSWDNSGIGTLTNWFLAYQAWTNGLIAAGRSAPFTTINIGGSTRLPPRLNNDNGATNGMMSFNLYFYTNVAPIIVSPPISQSVPVGYTFDIGSVAVSPSVMGWRWMRNGTNLAGATWRCLTISNATPADSGSYSVVVSNQVGSVTSEVAVVWVGQAPSRPSLTIERTATNSVVVSWPLPAEGWALERTNRVAGVSGTWPQVSPPYETNSSQAWIVVPAPAENSFYRLRKD